MFDPSTLARAANALASAMVSCALFAGTVPATAKDIAGSGDHALVGRYKGSEIIVYQSSDFDRVDLLARPVPRRFDWSGPLPEDLRTRQEGRSFRIVYRAPADRSALEVDANYAESLKAKGFETLFSCVDRECVSGDAGFYQLGGYLDDSRRNGNYGQALPYRLARLSRPEGDVHVAVLVGKGLGATHVALRIVESKAMQGDEIAFVDSSQMRAGLETGGRIALYGILFDFDRAEVKAESAPTLRDIARLMQAQPTLRLVVTGHTDGKGSFDYNLDLSQRRARAVVEVLARDHAVPAERLLPFGAGMAAPLASNEDETGRAKNRRVELVKR